MGQHTPAAQRPSGWSRFLRSRIPTDAPIRGVSLNGKPWKRFTRDSIELNAFREPLALEVRYQRPPASAR